MPGREAYLLTPERQGAALGVWEVSAAHRQAASADAAEGEASHQGERPGAESGPTFAGVPDLLGEPELVPALEGQLERPEEAAEGWAWSGG